MKEPSMRINPLVVAALLATVAVPKIALAVVVVRHPVYRPVATAVVVAAVVVIATKPPPSTPPPPPSAPPLPPVTVPLPIDSTMWQLPTGCLKLSVSGEIYYQCGPSWLMPRQSDKGAYYQVVPPPAPAP
jgi:hypothetical protein